MVYAAVISQEGPHTLARFPDAPGCQTFAGKGQDIAEEAREALEGWLEAHLAAGEVPPPVGRRAPRVGRGEYVMQVAVSAKLALQVGLRQARHAAGLTQAQLARRVGVSQQAIAKVESPDANPSIDTLQKVARALGAQLVVSLGTPAGK